MQNRDTATIENLARLLEPWLIDWEPRLREQGWSPRRRRHKTGL